MNNAKKELVEFLNGCPKVKCAEVVIRSFFVIERYPRKEYFLKIGYTQKEFDDLIDFMDVDYDSEADPEEFDLCIDSTIWFDDGTWATRIMDEEMQFWLHYRLPEIPERLKKR